MTDNRFNWLAILSTESALTIDMNGDGIINSFTKQNPRRILYFISKFDLINLPKNVSFLNENIRGFFNNHAIS